MGTGFPAEDAQSDFARARRSRMLADLARRLRFEPDDVGYILPFEEVVEALGRVAEHDLGLQTIELDSIVGTVDRTKEFDRAFRPTSPRLRARWQRIAEAQRRGESFPPISVYRIGELHFVRDGHHRVSVARSLGRTDIDAYVTEVQTRVGPGGDVRISDLPVKGHERLFRERVPLDRERRERDQALRPVGLRLAGRGRRGLGLPRHAGPPCVHGPRRGRPAVVRRGLQAGHRDARRGGARRARRDRDRRLHARS